MKRPRPDNDPRGWTSLPGALFLSALTRVFCLVPAFLCELLAQALARILYAFLLLSDRSPKRSRVVRNLQIAFGETLSEEERRQLTWEFSLHAFRLAIETLRLPRLDHARARELVDWSEIDGVFALPTGFLVATGHFGNWEILAYAGSYERRLVSLARPFRAAWLQRWFRAHRGRSGHDVHSKFGGLRALRSALGRGCATGVLVDENVRKGGLFVPFCGVLASTHRSAAFLQRVTGAPIAVITCNRLEDGKFKAHLWDLIEHDPSLEQEQETLRVTQAIARGFEASLRRYPAQWLWTLQRWRTRPEGETPGPDGLPARVAPALRPEQVQREPRVSRTRRAALVLATLLLLLTLVFLAGPRRRVDPARLSASALPALSESSASLSALASAVAAREASLGDVSSDCLAQVTFVGAPVQTELALVYLHGFSATRQETAPLAQHLAQALGANLYEARLRGHGRPGARLGEARAEEWLADAAEALALGRRLGRRVVLLSCSTGSSLAAWLLTHGHAEGVAASIWISPNFGTHSRAAWLLTGPWGEDLVQALVGPERSWRPISEAHGAYWTTRYPSRALVEMQATVDLACGVDLGAHATPLLMIYSPRDLVLDPAAMVEHFASVGAERKEQLAFSGDGDPSHHVLAGDVLSPGSTAAIQAHIQSFLADLPPEAP